MREVSFYTNHTITIYNTLHRFFTLNQTIFKYFSKNIIYIQ
jgi:hypothetical protein